ncbi:hypothetical protein ACM66B_001463 [Microbotryomycetes sp. NB124-2]
MSLEPPFALTYIQQAPDLPAWLSYTSSPTGTTTALFSVATLDQNGVPTYVTGQVVRTLYETRVVQVQITTELPFSVPLGALYTTAGGTGPTVVSVLGETGSLGAITLAPSSSVIPGSGSSSSGNDDTPSSTTAASLSSSAATSSAHSRTSSEFSASTAPPSTSAGSPSTLSSVDASSSSVNAGGAPAMSTRSENALDSGQIAGISIGVILAALLASIWLCCAVMRRRRRRRRAREQLDDSPTLSQGSRKQSGDWTFMPTVSLGSRRGSGATGTSNLKDWWSGLLTLVTSASSLRKNSATSEPTAAAMDGKGSTSKETSPLTGAQMDSGGSRRFQEEPLMREVDSPRSAFSPLRPQKSPLRYGTTSPNSRKLPINSTGSPRHAGEASALMAPFRDADEKDDDEDEQGGHGPRASRTPDIGDGWEGAALATAYLDNVHEDWLATPETPARSSPTKASRVYPQFRFSGAHEPIDEEKRLEGSPSRRTPLLAEFEWMRDHGGGGGIVGGGLRSPPKGSPRRSGALRRQVHPPPPSSAWASWYEHVRGSSAGGQSAASSTQEELDDAPNAGELFYNAPRWLGNRSTTQSPSGANTPGSMYPDTVPESPMVYPFVNPLTPGPRIAQPRPSPSALRNSVASSSAGTLRGTGPNRNSDGMLDRIAASFGVALAGLGVGQHRQREESRDSSERSSSSQSFGSTPRRRGPRPMPRAAQPMTPERSNPIQRSATTPGFRPGSALGTAPPSPTTTASDAMGRYTDAHESLDTSSVTDRELGIEDEVEDLLMSASDDPVQVALDSRSSSSSKSPRVVPNILTLPSVRMESFEQGSRVWSPTTSAESDDPFTLLSSHLAESPVIAASSASGSGSGIAYTTGTTGSSSVKSPETLRGFTSESTGSTDNGHVTNSFDPRQLANDSSSASQGRASLPASPKSVLPYRLSRRSTLGHDSIIQSYSTRPAHETDESQQHSVDTSSSDTHERTDPNRANLFTDDEHRMMILGSVAARHGTVQQGAQRQLHAESDQGSLSGGSSSGGHRTN